MKKRTQRGFSLMAAIVAVAIIAMIMGTAMTLKAKKQVGAAHDSYVDQQSREMALLASAVENYIDAHEDEFLHGVPRVVTLAELQGKNLLPAAFATRKSEQGTTPFYQGYRIVSIADDGDADHKPAVRTVIYETGEIDESRMARVGSEKTANGITGLKEWVAQDLVRKRNVPSGVVAAGTATAKGSMGMFTMDISEWLAGVPPPPSETTVAALVGFPELEPKPPEIEITLPEQSPWGECEMFGPTLPYWSNNWAEDGIPASCPAGQTNIAQVPYCTQSGHSVIYPSDVGSLTTERVTEMGMEHAIITGYNVTSGVVGGSVPPRWSVITNFIQDRYDKGLIWLNGKVVYEDNCKGATYSQERQRWRADYHPPHNPGLFWESGTPRTPLEIHNTDSDEEYVRHPHGEIGGARTSPITNDPAVRLALGFEDSKVLLCCLPAPTP